MVAAVTGRPHKWTRPIQKCEDCGVVVMSVWLLGSKGYCVPCYQKRCEDLRRRIVEEFPIQGSLFKEGT
jgi:hypothetical protein